MGRLVVVAGAHDIAASNEPTQKVADVKSIMVHPNYDSDTYLNDIALIFVSSRLTIFWQFILQWYDGAFNQLSSGFKLDETIKSIQLSQVSKAEIVNGTNVTVAGWGIVDPVSINILTWNYELNSV